MNQESKMKNFVAGTLLAVLANVPLAAQTPPQSVVASAQTLLASAAELKGAQIAGWLPMHAPASSRIAYWEAKLVSPSMRPNGAATVRADGRVVEFTSSGIGPAERVLLRSNGARLKAVRFGPHYVAAENEQGQRVFGIGRFPRPIIDVYTNLPLVMQPMMGGTRDDYQFIPQAIDPLKIKVWPAEQSAYADYVSNYEAWFEVPRPIDMFAGVSNLMDPDPSKPGPDGAVSDGAADTLSGTSEARGEKDHDYVNQLMEGDPMNTEPGYATGCGGQAFLNLFLWHDRNWTPSLLYGIDTKINPVTDGQRAGHLNELRNYLGTWESFSDLGATWPTAMIEGIDYARFKLSHYTDWASAFSYSNTGWMATEKLAKDFIHLYGKPVIIGYTSDVHYDVAYRVQKHPAGDGRYMFYIDFDGGKWIDGNAMFYAGGAFDFRTTSSMAGYNAGFEHGLNGWHSQAPAGGAIFPVVNGFDMAQGTAAAVIEHSQGGTGRLWKRVDANLLPSAQTVTVKAWVRVKAGSGVIRARYATGQPSQVPAGAVMASASFSALPTWQQVSFTMPAAGKFDFEIETTVPQGSPAVFVDGFETSTKHAPQQEPGPMGPCVKGKFGLDEGCPEP